MKLYFATWLYDKTLGESLTKTAAEKRLLSFHFLKEMEVKKVELKRYCVTGKFDPKHRMK